MKCLLFALDYLGLKIIIQPRSRRRSQVFILAANLSSINQFIAGPVQKFETGSALPLK
jgi:hypothetical protein